MVIAIIMMMIVSGAEGLEGKVEQEPEDTHFNSFRREAFCA